MVLICLSVSLLFPFLVLCLCPNPHFHFLHRSSINLFQPLPLPSASSSGLSISPRSTCSCFTSPLLFSFLVLFRPFNIAPSFSFSFSFSFSSGLYFSAPDVPPVANIVFLPPPPDMAKGAICALLAILGHFFEAFSPLDLFFALAPFRPVPRPFPASLHPGCRRLVSPRSRTCPRLRLTAPVRPCQPSPAPRRAHQAPFYARGLLKIIAVSENAPGAHGDVPRAQGVPRARSIP